MLPSRPVNRLRVVDDGVGNHGSPSATVDARAMSSAQDETKLETPHLSASVLQHGHHFTSLVVRGSQPDAATTDALGGFADLDAYHNSVTRAFFNCIVGRYANRLPAGESRFSTGAKIQLTGTDQGQSAVLCIDTLTAADTDNRTQSASMAATRASTPSRGSPSPAPTRPSST